MASEVAQVLEYLPNNYEALSTNASTAYNNNKKLRQEGNHTNPYSLTYLLPYTSFYHKT
jgi:hypothetical protein